MFKKLLPYILVYIILLSGCNPFSPEYDDKLGEGPALSDLTTIDGVFQNFRYAYDFKDTIIYGQLLSSDFIFTFTNFSGDQVIDDSWGREEEMLSTYNLFQNAQRLELIWNNIVFSTEDSLNASVTRGFNLNVILNPTSVLTVNGRVNMAFRKNPETNKWSITRWRDDSNF